MKFTKQDIIEYYDKSEISFRLFWDLKQSMAMHYGYTDEKARTFRQSLARFNEILVERANINRDDHVFDAGCGVGGSSVYIAKNCQCTIEAATVCPKQIVKANENAKKNGVKEKIIFHEMDYCNTGFEDEQFSVVWGLESICYANEKKKFLQEAYRILKPGGRIIIADGFAARETYEGDDEKMMKAWLDGWAVNNIETGAAFIRHGEDIGFKNMYYKDVSKNVFPSSRKMFIFSIPAIILAKIQFLFGFISYLESIHSVTLYNQYAAMKKGLWQYGIFYGEKRAVS